ncbi:hypothetical protein, partial [Bacillus sp. SIMBA_033]|uniref:hypothetical protein n=1 Tax=Bacillus sp. SIMBA_033 TaxID=3085776 RepID=UPI00397B0177
LYGSAQFSQSGAFAHQLQLTVLEEQGRKGMRFHELNWGRAMKVFIFGTLKRGFALHTSGLNGANYLGDVETIVPLRGRPSALIC